jgi:DNA recombination protein RmuC
LLDKFHGFAETLEDVGRHIDRSHEAYAKAMKQLREGRGNLAEQARKLRALGIKSAKPVPDALRPAHDEPDPDESGPMELQ